MNKLNIEEKKIAVVYQYKFPESRGGGERRLFEVFKRFDCPIDWYVQSADTKLTDSGINYISLSKKKFKYRSILETFLWPLMVLKIPFAKYDFIHVGQMPFFHIFTLIFKLKMYKILGIECPTITIDWWEHWGSYWHKFRFPINILGIFIEKFILRYSNNFIVISNKTKRDIENRTKANISLVHNGIDLQLIESVKIKKSANFIYFGRLEKHKGVDRCLIVFSELIKLDPTYRFEIIGDGSYQEALKSLVSKLNLTRNVHFSGRLDDNEKMYSLVKGADCMLSFGSQEGGGSITLFEANACGIPVAHAFSKNGIDKDLITERNGFFFESFDQIRIAKTLHLYVQSNEQKKLMRETCIDFVKDKGWDNISDQYKKYFKII